LSLLDINLNMVLRSCGPAVSMLGDGLLCLLFPAVFKRQETAPSKFAAVLLLVLGSALTVVSMHDMEAVQTQHFSFGIGVCLLSLIASWLEMVLTGFLSVRQQLSPVSSVLWMAPPAACLLLVPACFVRHPNSWTPDWMTDLEIALVAARWSFSCFALALFSGVLAVGYNVLLYTCSQQFSPTEVAIASTTNKVLLVIVVIGSGFASLPKGARLFQFVLGFALAMLSVLWITWIKNHSTGKSAALLSGSQGSALKK